MRRPKATIFRRILRSTVFALVIGLIYAILLGGYVEFTHKNEWADEQKQFEALGVGVLMEKNRVVTSAANVEIVGGKYTFTQSDIQGIIMGFLNRTAIDSSVYNFHWLKSQCTLRVHYHAFMIYDNPSLEYNKLSTKMTVIFYRVASPIFATFIMGAGVSALFGISHILAKVKYNPIKEEALTDERNAAIRGRAIFTMVFSVINLVYALFIASWAMSKQEKCSLFDGMKLLVQMTSTILPIFNHVRNMTDALGIGAFFLNVNTAIGFLIVSFLKLLEALDHSKFSVPFLWEIGEAHRIDKIVRDRKYALRRKMLGHIM